MKFTGYDHLERWEGLRLTAYKDVAGVWTIGYGSTGSHVFPGKTITKAEADALMEKDLERFVDSVNRSVKVPITQNQFNALVSLAYNIGVAGFEGSTALKRLNQRNYQGAAEAITWWNKAGGRVVKGLVNRRASEKELFLTPDVVTATTDADLFELAVGQLLREYTNKIVALKGK